MRKHFTLILLLPVLFYQSSVYGQHWVEMMQDPAVSFYATQQAFNEYWQDSVVIQKGQGYKQFRRWEYYMEPRVYPSGDITLPSRAYEEFVAYQGSNPQVVTPMNGTWSFMGPTGSPVNGGAGRINFVRFDPTNTSIMYAGAPAGGLWKSTNGGSSWTTNTDWLTVIGCTDIAIDYTNTQIMYLATGDGDAGDTYSIGVLKSTDGGSTWNTTGLTWPVTLGRTISKLLMHPTNPSILLAATSNGVFRTTNAGVNWTTVLTGSFKDMEMKPGDPNTVYVSGQTFYRSTNGGVNWTQITSGIPTGVSRLAIAVTPANPNYVYVLAANNSNYGLTGVYRSTNSGTSFTQRVGSSPNLLGWSSSGSGSGGQGWYDLAIAASNTNAEVILVGGVNIWRSTNGGSNWSINAHWTGSGAPYVHADIHDIVFVPGSGTQYFAGTDGGVARTTNSGSSWTELNSGLQIAQQYRIGLSASNPNLLLTGHQDNGTNRYNGTNWTEVYGGDGMDCFIDRTNNNTMYASYVYGAYYRSTNGGGSWTSIVNGLTGNAAWLAPWHQDPVTANTIYCGYQNIFRSTNQGNSWSQIGILSSTNTNRVVEFAVAPSNVSYIYAIKSNACYRTTNGGTSWTAITSGLPTSSVALTYITVSPTDPSRIWVTCSGYSASNKVFMSTNGGTNWTNYTTGLPNLPANCIVYENGSNDALYVGTDVGVYYRDNSLASWQPYMNGLPNVVVADLEIYYPTSKLRAATFGRGTWQVDLYTAAQVAPTAAFSASPVNACPGQTVTFTDQSTGNPTSWNWSFPGGTPASSTSQNPTVTYSTPGTYNVTLTASNANGTHTTTQTNYITVAGSQPLPLVEGFQPVTFPPANWSVFDQNGNGITWTRTGTAGGWGTSTASARFDNFNNDEAGARDELQTFPMNLTGYATVTLTFDVAYARYSSTYSDTLAVMISTNCGTTWSQIWVKGGNTLSTNGAVNVQNAIFVPTSSQWRTETISLNTYVNQANVRIAFQNRGRFGQAVYLDNVNITGTTIGAPPVADFTASPTSVCTGYTVTFTDQSTNFPSTYNWTFPGGTPASSNLPNPVVTYNTPGTYDVTLQVSNIDGSDTEIKTDYITVNASPSANVTGTNTICAGGSTTLTATGGGSYSWNTGPTTAGILVSPSSTTTYTVTVTNASGCTATATRTVNVNSPASPVITPPGPSLICGTGSVTLTSSYASGNAWSTGSNNQAITVSTGGVYTVTYTDGAGCTATASHSVVMGTIPANPVITPGGPTTFCDGGSVTLSSSYPTNNIWSNGNGNSSIVVTNNGTYSVTYTNADGCTSSSTITVIVHPLPGVSLSSLGTHCLDDASFTLTGGSPAGGTFSGTGVSGGSFNPQSAGIGTHQISYSYVDGNGCTGSATETIQVLACVGLNNSGDNLIVVYPNPTMGILYVRGFDGQKPFTVYDMSGKILFIGQVTDGGTIDLTPYPNAMYFLGIDGNYWRIVKQ